MFVPSIKYFSYFWQRVFRTSIFLILLMSLFRFILFVRVPYSFVKHVTAYEIFKAFFLGMRFDILVFSFLLSPLLVASYFWLCGLWGARAFQVTHIYFVLIWGLICLVSLFGGFHFLVFQKFLRLGSYGAIFEYPWSVDFQKIAFQSLNYHLDSTHKCNFNGALMG